MERSRFFAFIFSFVPGAGQMYLGLMKKGSIILSLFCGIGFFSAFVRIELFLMFLPVIWFYSFFDTLNLKRLRYEQRIENEDAFMEIIYKIFGKFISQDFSGAFGKRHLLVGGICIFAGIYIIFDTVVVRFIFNVISIDSEYFHEIRRLVSSLPTLAIAVIIIIFGNEAC